MLGTEQVGLPTVFFEAEDGIRNHCVTGVQTCALPISAELFGHRRAAEALAAIAPEAIRWAGGEVARGAEVRSEERRVGKECGRWGGRGEDRGNTQHREREIA